MFSSNGKEKMSREEISELLVLKGWTKTRLAVELNITENAVRRWFINRNPSGPAVLMMRRWLTDAKRKKLQTA